MIRVFRYGVIATALVAVACADGPAPSPDHRELRRLALLDEAFSVRGEDPARAARLFADAGPGPVLERTRLEAWLEALSSSNATVEDWRMMAAAVVPADLEARAAIGLAETLVKAERVDEAVDVLERVSDSARAQADEALLDIVDGPWRKAAAARLAVAAPHRLRRTAPQLEEAATAGLDAGGRLARATAWSEAGYPSRAAGELRRERFENAEERRRVLDLARHEIAAGSPARGMGALRSLPAADPEVQVIHAAAARRQGWQRFPRSTARTSFRSCYQKASSALGSSLTNLDLRREALRLVVECGTETNQLEDAAAAWWQLEGLGWVSTRRMWLGRRLGVALARENRDRETVLRLASAMPAHERCLRFWVAVVSDNRADELRELASADIPDLYGRWALEALGQPRPRSVDLASPVIPASPPEPVAWLLSRQALDEAAAEWRRTRMKRGSWPADGLAEAELAELRGRRMDAIRALRAGMPSLGTVAMVEAPANGVRAYLPLQWQDVLRSAAADTKVEPWLLAGVARQESGFVAHARSPRSAKGVMQLLEGTASGHARALGFGRRPDLMDPEENIRIGARELERLLDRFGAVEPALAAYNAGETRVRKWWADSPDRYRFTETIPIPETYNYVRRVTFLAEAYRLVYRDQWEGP